MDSHKYTTDSGTEFNMLGNGGVIIKDVAGSTIGLSEESMSILNNMYSWGGWNTSFNDKHKVEIKALDTVFLSWLKKCGIIERINQALDYFPELHMRTIHIGIIEYNRDKCDAAADIDNHIIQFNMDRLQHPDEYEGWNVVIFHELMHMVQYISDTSKSEEHCSIHAMARMPNHLVDVDYISYIGNGNKNYNADICRKAVKYKESGKRGYIKYAKALLDEVVKNDQ